MTAAEMIKLGDILGRQKKLYERIKEKDCKLFEDMTPTEQRQLD